MTWPSPSAVTLIAPSGSLASLFSLPGLKCCHSSSLKPRPSSISLYQRLAHYCVLMGPKSLVIFVCVWKKNQKHSIPNKWIPVSIKFYWHTAISICLLLSMAAFTLQQQSWHRNYSPQSLKYLLTFYKKSLPYAVSLDYYIRSGSINYHL